jgi:hypothetical protein
LALSKIWLLDPGLVLTWQQDLALCKMPFEIWKSQILQDQSALRKSQVLSHKAAQGLEKPNPAGRHILL